VEFAVVLAFVIVPLMLGMMELSRVMSVAQLLDNAARRGCRTAITQGKANTDVLKDVNDIVQKDNNLVALSVVTDPTQPGVYIAINGATGDVTNANGGDKITVKVSVATSNALLYWPKTFFFSSIIESQFLTMMRQAT
jgi:Flp pilus assembly protein TadG